MSYKLSVLRIFTRRWPESVEFYRDKVGFPLSFIGEAMGWAEFDLGAVSLGLERFAPEDPEVAELVGRFVGASIEVEDIGAVYERLTAKGVEFVGPPERQPWGGSLAHFKDPDGNVLTLLDRGT